MYRPLYYQLNSEQKAALDRALGKSVGNTDAKPVGTAEAKPSDKSKKHKKARKAHKGGASAKKSHVQKPLELIKVKSHAHGSLLLVREEDSCRPLVEKDLQARIKNYNTLSAKKRRRKANRLIGKSTKVVVKLGRVLNAPGQIEIPEQERYKGIFENYRSGAHALLSLPGLCPGDAGLRIFDTLICGLQASSLRKQFPNLKLHLHIKTDSQETAETVKLIEDVLCLFILKKEWKGDHFNLKRIATQDYQVSEWEFPPKPIDFSCLTIKLKKGKKLRIPFPYWNTVVAVINADKKQRDQAEEYRRDAAVIHIGGKKPKDAISIAIEEYYDDILTRLQAFAPQIAMVCWLWQKEQPVDALDGFVDEVYAALPSSGGHLRPLKTDSDKLRESVFTTVRKVFLRFLVDRKFIAPEEAAAFHDSLSTPKQAEAPSAVRNIEDPAVFLDVVRKMIADNPDRIVQHGQSYREVKNPLGAWRTHKKIECLMMLEATFEKEFPKAAKALGNVDLAMFSGNWLHPLQDEMVRENVIFTGSNTRYLRFDLLENGTRNSTHVVAIPKFVLDETDDEEVLV